MSPLVLSLVLACFPSMPETRTFEGPGVTLLQKVVEHGRVSLTMVEGPRRKRWHSRDFRGFHAPTFSADGRYVAEANLIHTQTVEVIRPDGRLVSYRPLEQHPWWRSIGPACASGLPHELVQCDGLHADELVSELRGQAKPR